jgi:Fe-S oxidoreductase
LKFSQRDPLEMSKLETSASQKLLGRKISNIEKTGAQVVASANPGCSAQLQAGLRQANKAWRIVHPISLLAEAYRLTEGLDRIN